MKNYFRKIAVVVVLILFAACDKDDENTTGGATGSCLADKIEISNKIITNEPSQSLIFIKANFKNISSTDYIYGNTLNIGNSIYTKVRVKTTDGTIIETKGPLLATNISAGATAVAEWVANYSAGQTYESHTLELYCQ